MKKKIHLLAIVLFFYNSTITFAQPSQFFPTKDAFWEEAFIGIIGSPLPTYLALCGDTVINNLTYTKLLSLQFDDMGTVTEKNYEGGTRTNGEIVWMVKPQATSEIVLYDFSLEPGNQITLETAFGDNVTLTVEHNELVNTPDGITRRFIYFLPQQNGWPQEYWIEGIGSSFGLLNRAQPPALDFDPYMNCFKFQGQLGWSNPDTQPECLFSFSENCGTTALDLTKFPEKINFTISPNPFQEQTSIKMEGLEHLSEPILKVFDLQGKLIERIEAISEENLIFSRKSLNAGLYVFELTDLKTTFAVRKKVIIQ